MNLQYELQHNALYGPFDNPPFPVHISPLMTQEKQNSDTRHTIMDLSWPKGLLLMMLYTNVNI